MPRYKLTKGRKTVLKKATEWQMSVYLREKYGISLTTALTTGGFRVHNID